MTRDLEAELRESLRARAGDVTPDPALYSRVVSRVRRGRLLRVASAGVAAALAVTGIALAAPRLTERRVDFEPPAVATQPADDPTSSSEPAPTIGAAPPLVFTDGDAVYGMGIDGDGTTELIASACPTGGVCDMEPVRSVTVQPTGSGADTAVVTARTCAGLRDNRGNEPYMADTCPTSATFSPDGNHLAWVGQADPDGEWMLHTAEWTDTGVGDATSFGLGFGADETVRLEEWSYFNPDEGHIYVRVTGPDGTRVLTRPIRRQADGALALPGCGQLCDLDLAPYRPAGGMPGYSAVAAAAGPQAGEYVLEVLVRDGAVTAGHVADDANGRYLDLPETFLSSLDPSEIDQLWLSSDGTDLLLGDGKGVALAIAWEGDDPPIVQLDADVVHGDLLAAIQGEAPTEPVETTSQFDVYFGMSGADACVADQPIPRSTTSAGVARAALTELLKGPSSRESNEGIQSPFTANTAGALNDITIDEGQARVDFADFSGDVGDDSCTKSAIVDSLDQTLKQFPTITSTRYSFDGSIEAWQTWLGSGPESPPAMPTAVEQTAEQILQAARTRDWDALRRLSEGTSCTMSDQPEPCVPYWKSQEANGEDPLGLLVEVLEQQPTYDADGALWYWSRDSRDYTGPRVGISGDDAGWQFYVQSGG